MKGRFSLSVLVTISVLFIGTAYAGEFKVVKIYDGDSFAAIGHDIEIKVRLMGIDAPEMGNEGAPGQPCSQEAKEHLTDLVYGKMVDVKGYGVDGDNRVLGVVFLDGKNVNLEMVKAGLAEVYRGKIRKDFYLLPYTAAERQARTMQKGIWSMGTIYVSPRVWRKGRQ